MNTETNNAEIILLCDDDVKITVNKSILGDSEVLNNMLGDCPDGDKDPIPIKFNSSTVNNMIKFYTMLYQLPSHKREIPCSTGHLEHKRFDVKEIEEFMKTYGFTPEDYRGLEDLHELGKFLNSEQLVISCNKYFARMFEVIDDVERLRVLLNIPFEKSGYASREEAAKAGEEAAWMNEEFQEKVRATARAKKEKEAKQQTKQNE